MMTILIPVLAFAGVAVVIGIVGLVVRDRRGGQENRLDAFTRATMQESSTANVDIWKAQAFEGDKKSLMEQVIPALPNLKKVFEQAECHVKPNTLLMISW